MLTLLAFVLALGLLITIHEYGHYRMALACGVKVLKFSIGFGKPLLTWHRPGKPTEFCIGMLPLGGYVQMLDEREAPVDAAERHLAFNRQPLRSRALVVVAGPVANLLLAVLLYSAVNWIGYQEPQAVLARPLAGSLAERAGLQGGELVTEAAEGDGEMEPLQSFDDLRWQLTQAALKGQNLRLRVQASDGAARPREVTLALSELSSPEPDAQMFRKIGLLGPLTRPVLGRVMPEGAAQEAGLREGDLVLRVGDRAVVDGQQLRDLIRSSRGEPELWQVQREGQSLALTVKPQLAQESPRGQPVIEVGRIGAFVGAAPAQVLRRDGAWDGLVRGAVKTWDISALTVAMMGKMLVGEASLKNLSGPLTIADYAGKSAALGLTSYLLFLALISVSLGVLNLLPLPMLDGGHLMYYLWEAATGRPVSDVWMDRLQRGGIAVLLTMMSIALFNDVTRLLG